MEIIKIARAMYCRECHEKDDKNYTLGLIEFVLKPRSNKIIGLTCPECKETIVFYPYDPK